MNKRTLERGYKYAKTHYEKEGRLPDMTKDIYDLCSADFRQGVVMFSDELKNNLKKV